MAQPVSKIKRIISGRKFLHFFFKNWHLKLLSLFIGVCTWYLVAGEDQVDMTIQVPIEILNLPSDLVISNQYKKDIEVAVRGPRRMIQDIRNHNISRPLDLSKAEPGTKVLQNDPHSIDLPRGVSVIRLQPTSITLLLDKLIEKKFPIDPITHGEVKDGYTLQALKLTPKELTITGPKHVLDSTTVLTTYVIDLDGLDHSTTLQVNLNLTPAFIRLIGETVVTARLTVQEEMVAQTINDLPVNVRDATAPTTTEPATVSVIASIPANLVSDTPELAMLFRAYVTAQPPLGAKKLPVIVKAINVPDHEPIKILSVKPKEVMVIPVKKILDINPLQQVGPSG